MCIFHNICIWIHIPLEEIWGSKNHNVGNSSGHLFEIWEFNMTSISKSLFSLFTSWGHIALNTLNSKVVFLELGKLGVLVCLLALS